MKVVVVGKGGREHALVKAFVDSGSGVDVYGFPGSVAIFNLAKRVAADDLESLVSWMKANHVDLCVAGEESYLVNGVGLANLCEQEGIPCWGPHKQSAQLEASKEFAKKFMKRNKVPTAKSVTVNTYDEAMAAIGGVYPTVLKFDGLAAGKGVAVCTDEEQAKSFLQEVLVDRKFGPGRLLVEECLTGPEVSIFAAVADHGFHILAPARDYKRALDGDAGGNTGGMGAVASRHLLDAAMLARIEDEIVRPTVKGLFKEELPYRGFLYFGLMLTPDGPKVIEYNCRFGDPECQAVMPLVQGDLAAYCLAGAKGTLDRKLISFSDAWSVAVILASAGYPESSRKGDVIQGIDDVTDARVYHSGTRKQAGEWVTNGGRVLAVVAQGENVKSAADKAHAEAAKITFDGSQRRSDIGRLHF